MPRISPDYRTICKTHSRTHAKGRYIGSPNHFFFIHNRTWLVSGTLAAIYRFWSWNADYLNYCISSVATSSCYATEKLQLLRVRPRNVRKLHFRSRRPRITRAESVIYLYSAHSNSHANAKSRQKLSALYKSSTRHLPHYTKWRLNSKPLVRNAAYIINRASSRRCQVSHNRLDKNKSVSTFFYHSRGGLELLTVLGSGVKFLENV